ncbi:hypothetical protein BH11ARM1_BH11ARM1_01440 [soil metagenome]
MRISEVLRHITEEAQILDTHIAMGHRDAEFLQAHADSLVSYGLLLRDMADRKVTDEERRARLKHLIE